MDASALPRRVAQRELTRSDRGQRRDTVWLRLVSVAEQTLWRIRLLDEWPRPRLRVIRDLPAARGSRGDRLQQCLFVCDGGHRHRHRGDDARASGRTDRLEHPSDSAGHTRRRRRALHLPCRLLSAECDARLSRDRRRDGARLAVRRSLADHSARSGSRHRSLLLGADRVEQRCHRVRLLQYERHAGPRRHERHERAEERTLAMHAVELLRLRGGEVHDARSTHAKAMGLEVRDDLAGLVRGEGVWLDDRERVAIRHGQDPMSLRTMSLRVRNPTRRPSWTTGTLSTSLLVIKLATSESGWSGETQST